MRDLETSLSVGGEIHRGWTDIRISRGIEQIAGTFNLKVSERWPGLTSRRVIRPGEACKVSIGNEVVITGYIDDAAPSYDKESHACAFTGRDVTGNLVDCSAMAKPGEWHGLTLDAIVAALVAPFGIGVSVAAGADLGKPFGRFAIQPGDTVFAMISKLCKIRAVLPVSDGRCGILLTRGGTAKAAGRLVLGKNILRGAAQLSDKERFSDIFVRSQTGGLDLVNPEDAYFQEGKANDPAIARYRPLLVMSEQLDIGAAFTTRADWEVRTRAGRGRRFTYAVRGWTDDAGSLWQPNTLISVDDAYLGLDEDLLITAVEFAKSDAGTLTTLQLAPPEAFELLPLPLRYEQAGA